MSSLNPNPADSVWQLARERGALFALFALGLACAVWLVLTWQNAMREWALI